MSEDKYYSQQLATHRSIRHDYSDIAADDEDDYRHEAALCDVCQRIDFFHTFGTKCPNCSESSTGTVGVQTGIQLSRDSLGRLERNQGHPGCSLILSCINAYYSQKLPPPASKIRLSLRAYGFVQLDTSPSYEESERALDARVIKVRVCTHGLCGWRKKEDDEIVGAIAPLPGDEAGLGATKSDFNPFSTRKLGSDLGLVPRKTETFVNNDLVRSWLQNCQKEHGDLSGQRLPITVPDAMIRLIDTKDLRLVKCNLQTKFVALSYVWGVQTEPLLTKSVEEKLSQPGGVCIDELPRAIGDAIYLTRKLSQRYIWVDSGCIVQDDEVDKREQLKLMDSIFNLAEIVVVAASSNSAHSGIPGIGKPRMEWPRPTALIQGSKFTTLLPDLLTSLDSSIWQSRGRTFQEGLLAHRLLIFDDLQVFWNCRVASYSEDRFPEYNNTRSEATHENSLLGRNRQNACRVKGAASLLAHDDCHLLEYTKKVENFTSRRFTDQNDVLWAFSGILKLLKSNFPAGYIWGIPWNSIDAILLWNVDYSFQASSALHTAPEKGQRFRRTRFPSWTWLAKGCNVHYDSCGDQVISKVAWHDPILYENDDKIHHNCATNGCGETWSEPAVLTDIEHFTSETSEDTVEFGNLHLDASTAHLYVQILELLPQSLGCGHSSHLFAVAEISMPNGHVIGSIRCPFQFFKEKINNEKSLSSEIEKGVESLLAEKFQAEFLHLSTYRRAENLQKNSSAYCQDDYSYDNQTDDWHAPGCKFAKNVNLMMIQWDKDNKTAYRVGIVSVEESEWDNVETRPKRVVLG